MLKALGRTPNGTCPLCGGSAYVQSSQQIDGDSVVCDRCGHFRVERGALQGFEQQRHLIAGMTRRSSGLQPSVASRLTLTSDNIPDVLAGVSLAGGLLDHLDYTLEYVRGHQARSDEFVEYRERVEADFPLVFARDSKESLHFLQTLAEQGLLEEPPGRDPARRTSFRLTPAGWQRLRELAKMRLDSNRAFVAMWFNPELQSTWTEGIRPALKALGYEPVRIDYTHGEDRIDDRIIAEIRRSALVVADFTGHRGGVYFEAGLAMGLGIPVVWTCRRQDNERTHFDTRQYQHLLWDTPEDLRQQLVNHISARIPGRQLPPEGTLRPTA